MLEPLKSPTEISFETYSQNKKPKKAQPKLDTSALQLPYQGQIFRSNASQKGNLDQAYTDWKTEPNGDGMSRLMEQLKPQMQKSARRYAGDVDPVTMGKAKQLVIDSLDRYDPQKASLETYVDRQLQPLMRWNSRKNRQVRLPDKMQMDAVAIRRAIEDIENETGRDASARQIADHTGLPIKRIAKVRLADQRLVADSRAMSDDESGAGTAGDLPVVDDKTSHESWLHFIRDDLSPIDQVILERTTGLDGAKVWSNQELAARLRLSPSAISQRKARIQALIDQESELSPFS